MDDALITQYINELYGQESLVLRQVDHAIRTQAVPIHIAPWQGRLLQMLIRLVQAEKIVEIGTLAGYSTLWMAEAIAAGGGDEAVIYTIEKDPQRQQLAETSFQLAPALAKHIRLLKGDATVQLAALSNSGPFDLVFIDANKNGYLEYLEWATHHVRSGGLVIADNTLLRGAVCGMQVDSKIKDKTVAIMQEFNRRLADPIYFSAVMLPGRDGLSIAIRH